MPIEWFDGFDYYPAPYDQRIWDPLAVNGSLPGFMAGGRFGTGASMQCGNSFRGVTCSRLTNRTTRVMGFAIYNPSLVANADFCQFLDLGTVQVSIGVVSGISPTTLQVRRGGTTVLGTSTLTLITNQWYFIEIKATIDPTAGSVQVFVDGVNFINVSGVNTRNSANSYCNYCRIQGLATESTLFDDVYIHTDTLLGDSRVIFQAPNADDASFKTWTPSTGTSHVAMIHDSSTDDDSTYNKSNNPGNIDLYSFAPFTPTGYIAALKHTYIARKDDAGPRTIADVIRSAGNNYIGASQALAISYIPYPIIFETDPATGLPWTTAGVNAAELGVKVIS